METYSFAFFLCSMYAFGSIMGFFIGSLLRWFRG